jgi:NTP pyrophosphatase (non-canonical NTP hydrolase)
MNIKEYQQLALRTEARNPEHTQADRWNHGALGLITEAREFFAARDSVGAAEEFGDLMWYVVLLADVAQVDLSTIEHPDNVIETLATCEARCADIGKRWKYYNIPPSEPALKEAVTRLFINIVEIWARLGPLDFDSEDVLDGNIAKLKTRYPEKFTTEAAANRDLVAERAVLEGGAK